MKLKKSGHVVHFGQIALIMNQTPSVPLMSQKEAAWDYHRLLVASSYLCVAMFARKLRHINGFGASKCPTHGDNLQIITCDVEARHFDWRVYSILPTLPRLSLSLAFDRGNIDPRIIK